MTFLPQTSTFVPKHGEKQIAKNLKKTGQ